VAIDRDDSDVRIPYRNTDGAEVPLPIGAEVVLFETYGHPAPTFVFEDAAPKMRFPTGSAIVQMYPNVSFFRKLAAGGVNLQVAYAGDLPYAVVR
jgi:hypothetical protein